MRRIAILLFLLVLLPVNNAVGQVTVEDIIEGNISLMVTPSVPGPNQAARAQLESSSVDLDSSNVVWKLNGATTLSGKGERVLSFTTGPLGSRLTVTATITAEEGTFTKSITFEAGAVDLLWKGDGYVHPFYKGRTLWGNQTRITFMAIPHVRGANREALIYKWHVDGEVLGTSSGVGKSSLSFSDSILGLPKEVRVDVLTDRDTVAATASLTLSAISPQVVIYENNPLYGLRFEREVGETFDLNDEEVTFGAFPFYFSAASRPSSDLTYTWRTNNRDTQSGSQVTYRTPEAGSGRASVGVTVRHLNQVMQSVTRNFLVQFENENAL